VRYLVEAHGGTVTAESAGPGTGATFTVTLPAQQPVLPREPGVPEVKPASDGRRLHGIRLLLVDDSDDARELLAEALSETGARVDTAASAAEAFARLQTETPDVLISDVGMPYEDGFSFLRRVRALPPERGGEVPAIALTAYTRAEDIREAEAAGYQMHLVKPASPDQIITAVETFAARNTQTRSR
jgi:CheY-like chemotaxis protein